MKGQPKGMGLFKKGLDDDSDFWNKHIKNIGYSGWDNVERISKKLKDNRILDVGCGMGYLEKILSYRKFHDVTAIDISPVPKKLIEDIYGFKFFQQDINKRTRFKDHEFNTAVCIGTMEYLNNPVFALKEMLRISDEVILTWTNSFWLELRSPSLEFQKLPSYVMLTEAMLKELMKNIDASIIEIDYFYLNKNPLINLLRKFMPNWLCSGFIVTIRGNGKHD